MHNRITKFIKFLLVFLLRWFNDVFLFLNPQRYPSIFQNTPTNFNYFPNMWRNYILECLLYAIQAFQRFYVVSALVVNDLPFANQGFDISWARRQRKAIYLKSHAFMQIQQINHCIFNLKNSLITNKTILKYEIVAYYRRLLLGTSNDKIF